MKSQFLRFYNVTFAYRRRLENNGAEEQSVDAPLPINAINMEAVLLQMASARGEMLA